MITNGDLRNPLVLSDPDGILDNLTIDRTAGKVYADVKVVDEGFKRAEIRISAGALSRIVTVISCEKIHVRTRRNAFGDQQRRLENAYVQYPG